MCVDIGTGFDATVCFSPVYGKSTCGYFSNRGLYSSPDGSLFHAKCWCIVGFLIMDLSILYLRRIYKNLKLKIREKRKIFG